MLPSMNLLAKYGGYNHLANILVFITPLVTVLLQKVRRPINILVALCFLLLLIFTGARGAWIVVGAYIAIFSLIQNNTKLTKVLYMATSVSLFVVALAPFFINKGSLLRPYSTESRLEYWRQALEAVKEKPMFGSGPGTFSLVSKRLQISSQFSSWFAHSQPLEIAVEMGILGLLAFGWLAVCYVRIMLRALHKKHFSSDQWTTPLFWGLVLIFIYSFFEFVLSYFVIWLLFWAALGVCLSRFVPELKKKSTEHSLGISIGIICLFYLLWTSSNVVALITDRHDLPLLIAPFDIVRAKAYLVITPPSLQDERIKRAILYLY